VLSAQAGAGKGPGASHGWISLHTNGLLLGKVDEGNCCIKNWLIAGYMLDEELSGWPSAESVGEWS